MSYIQILLSDTVWQIVVYWLYVYVNTHIILYIVLLTQHKGDDTP